MCHWYATGVLVRFRTYLLIHVCFSGVQIYFSFFGVPTHIKVLTLLVFVDLVFHAVNL